MEDQPIAPSYAEIQSKADFHLQEAARTLTAQWPWWSGRERPSPWQRRAMRKANRRIAKARSLLAGALDQAPPPPASTNLDRPEPN